MSKRLNIGIVGYQFMGKAHSNGWLQAKKFFDLPGEPVLKVACGRSEEPLKAFAETWGWQEIETDWKKLVERDDIDIIDIAVPQNLHAEIAIAAVKAGKHIFCEKPIALNTGQAKEMLAAAEKAGIVHYLNHNYRRVPAVRLAKKLIDDGEIGEIYHWRGAYLQDWISDPDFPLTWHLQKDKAGSGPHGDLNSHSVDLARYLVGEIDTVMGMTKTFIEERNLPGEGSATFQAGSAGEGKKGKVTVEDAAFMLVNFKNGALGSFEASRFATGRKNYNSFEIYGSKGSICFNFERMNELQFLSKKDGDDQQGFRTILATNASHDYIAHWWPPGHIIGYEHEFVHAAVDFVDAVVNNKAMEPNFSDGVREMEVLDAGLKSAESGSKVSL
ncbi:MAG: Gfo/Idh/MocA family oxidoreductase [Spirochaetales bacterium]|nr:Gfo/Idh/MocA family oxidoreductase [Spirochaetales bacterium]MCF7939131.1 Gfo/Idh/MocA family oxidoreductase [Spirochaetales bacterium]